MSEQPPRGRILGVVGAKGGCGATMAAINLAVELTQPARACVLDLDFGLGDVAGYVDLWPQRSIHAAFEELDRLDPLTLRGAVTPHPGGFDILAQPYDLREQVHPSTDEVRRLLSAAAAAYDLVIADCGSRVSEALLAAAIEADALAVVLTPHQPAVRDAVRLLRLLRSLEIDPGKLRLVVNRWSRRAAVGLAEIEEFCGLPVDATLALDKRACRKADQRGQLLRDAAPHSAIYRDLTRLKDWLGEARRDERRSA